MTEAEQNDENTAFESVEPYEAPEVERLIQGLINVVDAARPVPLSSSSMVHKQTDSCNKYPPMVPTPFSACVSLSTTFPGRTWSGLVGP